ncbi:MAG TPA: CPBP family intramembrane metalloprotease [Saprospiraceae bacterium]|nr:CPBP family intramembrane metalloprotease [Saprospiraceae bacterium]
MKLFWLDHILFIVVGILIPILSLLSSSKNMAIEGEEVKMDLPPKKHLYYSNGLMLWIGAVLVITSWNITTKPWADLGINWPVFSTLSIYLILALLAIYLIDTAVSTYQYQKGKKIDDEEMLNIMPQNWTEYSHFIFLAVSAGVCEEIVFRGFLINYMREVLPSSPYNLIMSIIIPGMIFSISHFYQGFLNVFKIFSLSILFGAIFVLTKSLLIVAILHAMVDLISGAVFVILEKRKGQESKLP